MDTHKPYIFLLGGHDLEMHWIKSILEGCGYKKDENYFDAELNWNNASWSAYSEIINQINSTASKNKPKIVGIELFDDAIMRKADDWLLLDHHNERSSEPSSIEQLIKLLKYQPHNDDEKREIELIIANDQDAIIGLRIAGASESEIQKIRKAEEDILHINPEIKQLFEAEDHNKNYIKVNNVRIIKTLASSFYGLTESFNDSNIIIYNNSTLFFHGLEAKTGVLNYFKSIPGLKYFYGGLHVGYIGTKKLPAGLTLDDLVSGITNLHTNDIQSYHTFMFPFRWDYIKTKTDLASSFQVEKISLDNRLDFEKIIKELKNKSNTIKDITWETKQFDIINEDDFGMKYNEYMYFHPFVHQCIYDLPDDDNSAEELVKYFELKEGNSGSFIIKTQFNEYNLKLCGISMHIFKNGIGVLTFQLENYHYSDIESIININDFGRRIYPQFIDTKDPKTTYINATQNNFLPLSITLNFLKENNSIYSIYEDFSTFNCRTNLSRGELIRLPNYITSLLPNNFITAPNYITDNSFYIRPSLDDRMFSVSAIGNSLLAMEFCKYQEIKEQYNYENSVRWNRLIFNDNGWCTTQSHHLLNKLNILHTYDRWVNTKSLYGISRETFILLTTDFKPDTFSKNVLSYHMRYMYYQVAILCLVQRSGMLRFSGEVGAIASLNRKKTENNKTVSKTSLEQSITYLHMAYIEFVNKMFFREVTPQIQGIELYDKMHKIMRMDKDIKELDNEIQELYEYIMILQQTEEAKQSRNLNLIATILLPATLIFGILGANIYTGNLTFTKTIDRNAIGWIFIGIILSVLVSYLLIKLQPQISKLISKISKN